MTQLVQLEVTDGVALVQLVRPPMNALDAQVQRELVEVAREVDTRDDVAAVVLHGGPKVFAAGADVKEMAAMSYQETVRHGHLLQ